MTVGTSESHEKESQDYSPETVDEVSPVLLESGKYFIIIMDSGRLTWKSGCMVLATSVQKDCLETEWNQSSAVKVKGVD